MDDEAKKASMENGRCRHGGARVVLVEFVRGECVLAVKKEQTFLASRFEEIERTEERMCGLLWRIITARSLGHLVVASTGRGRSGRRTRKPRG